MNFPAPVARIISVVALCFSDHRRGRGVLIDYLYRNQTWKGRRAKGIIMHFSLSFDINVPIPLQARPVVTELGTLCGRSYDIIIRDLPR